MKLIPALLFGGMLAGSGWAQNGEYEPYSAELVKKAQAGDASAQLHLGWCYEDGNGVTQDYKEAVKWFTKSAEQGDTVAQSNLGLCYYLGKIVPQDYEGAVKWLSKSAEQGEANGQRLLGICYSYGFGVTQDKKEAVKWYTKSLSREMRMPNLILVIATIWEQEWRKIIRRR